MQDTTQLKISYWNANGAFLRKLEIEHFLETHQIDVFLISETHLTESHEFNISGFQLYDTKHPDGTPRGGTGILIRKSINHYALNEHRTRNIQATSICVELLHTKTVLSAVYCSPNEKTTSRDFTEFFSSLGHCFIAAGDFNGKHKYWGSRSTNTRGRQIMKVLSDSGLDFSSCGQPTYWPSDQRKMPDLIDFAITKGIDRNKISSTSLFDLCSDHSPVIIKYSVRHPVRPPNRFLTNNRTNWLKFKMYISAHLQPFTSLRTPADIDAAIIYLNELIVNATKIATPETKVAAHHFKKTSTSTEINRALAEKRRHRRIWQISRSPTAKNLLNIATRRLRSLLADSRQKSLHTYLSSLSISSDTDYSLWKETKSLKRPQRPEPPIRLPNGSWARSNLEKAEAFVDHFNNVFQPNPTDLTSSLPTVYEPSRTKPIKVKKGLIKHLIEQLDPKKAPGHDSITPKILQELPECALDQIVRLFNTILRNGYFPVPWKQSTIITIPKAGKDPTKTDAYRPISLLPVLSKVFEKALLSKIKGVIERCTPNHQFGFQARHSTIEQVHRVTTKIRQSFEKREYCTALFIDVAQAFDKVWHEGLIYKIKTNLPSNCHKLLESYLTDRTFNVRYKDKYSRTGKINAGVPQGSVLGPMLYVLFTADLPVDNNILTSTFADDTGFLSSNSNPVSASSNLQKHICKVEEWLKKWRIKVNETKCSQVTFTLNKKTCPQITLNQVPVPQSDRVRYLGIHLDRRLTWKHHVEKKKAQIKLKMESLNYLISARSPISLNLKVQLYRAIIKPIWLYGCELWQSASSSVIEIIQRQQNRALRIMTGAPWYVRNHNIHKDLDVQPVKDEIALVCKRYRQRVTIHPNPLARDLLAIIPSSRLRKKPTFL